ncbi:hypothetical protein LCGC14_1174700 [marine sediment metagenome]|uniref:Uncharacterized protein n=1 Tax=marine sediment metagenome TaxID=412755 RepID=A0A0F9LTS1_9ZZZZ
MSIWDIIINISTIITIIVGILGIIAFIMKLKWKTLSPKFRLKRKLKKYKKIRFNIEKERKKVREIFGLLHKAQQRFEYKDFRFSIQPSGHGDINVKGLYKIHLTPQGNSQPNEFKISRISNPNEAYYSEGYPEAQKVNSNLNVLDDIIKII